MAIVISNTRQDNIRMNAEKLVVWMDGTGSRSHTVCCIIRCTESLVCIDSYGNLDILKLFHSFQEFFM